MKNLFTLFALALTLATSVEAAPVRRLYQDVKLPTQVVLESQTVTAPIVATTNYILTTNAGDVTGATPVTITSFAHQPDVPRNITVTPTGTTADVLADNVIVTGTNIFNKTITENIPIGAAQSTIQLGTKAFKTVTSIVLPGEAAGHAATWIVGVGSKLGLKRCMAHAGDFFHAELNGVKEGTAPTVAADAANIESNTASLSSALNSNDVILYFAQNFGCFP